MYFYEEEIKPILVEMARSFPGGELVFDCYSRVSAWVDSRQAVLRKVGVGIHWGLADPASLASWGLHLQETYRYLDRYYKRLGSGNWMLLFPPFN